VIRRRLGQLAEKEPPLLICKPLVQVLLDGISKRFDRLFNLEYFQLAAVIHPKFKLCWLDDREENEKKLQKKIISRIEKKNYKQCRKKIKVIQALANLYRPKKKNTIFSQLFQKEKNVTNLPTIFGKLN
jgi:hypothetical protein